MQTTVTHAIQYRIWEDQLAALEAVPVLVIIGGQSNAAGFGTDGNDVPAELQGAMTDVYYWRHVQLEGAPVYGWATYEAGVNSVPNQAPGTHKWGPEAEFARQFRLQFPTTKLFMIKNSLSGSQLENTDVFISGGTPASDWHPDSVAELFDGTQGLIASAVAAMDTDFDITEFDGLVLWMQGETDAAYAETSATYYANLGAFITAVRAEWGIGALASFISGRIQPLGWTFNGPVRHAFALRAVDTTDVGMVDTDDLPLFDGIHYNAAGQQGLGLKFWQSYRNIISSQAISLPSTFEWTIEEQGGNGTVIGTIAPSNTPIPTPTFVLLSGETAGFALNANTGVLTILDGSQLVFASDASRVFVVQASNGINTVTTTVTVTLTESEEITNVEGTTIRWDPNDAGFYTLVATKYSLLTDTLGSGRTMGQSNDSRRPIQTLLPATALNSLDFNNGDGTFNTITAGASAAICDDTDEDMTFACIVHPVSTGANANFMVIVEGSSNVKLGVGYRTSDSKFSVQSILASNGTTTTGTTVNTFAADTTYRIRVRKVGTTLQLFVNDVEEATTGLGALRATILSAGQTAGCVLGGNGNLAGSFTGFVGLGRLIRANPTGPEIAFLNAELSGWLA